MDVNEIIELGIISLLSAKSIAAISEQQSIGEPEQAASTEWLLLLGCLLLLDHLLHNYDLKFLFNNSKK